MSFNLTLLNLWIGMCRGAAGLPKDLRRLGYQEKGIEFRFANQELDSVVPELVLASEQVHHTLLFEWKSGANTDADQLRRYSRVTREDLEKKALIRKEAARSHDVTIVGREEHGDRLKIGIDRGGYSFPILLVNSDGLALGHNEFRVRELTALFNPVLEIRWDRVPTRFVPLDSDSQLWEIAEVVIPMVLRYMSERRPRVTLNQICADVCNTWSIMGPPAQDIARSKVRQVLREAASRDFKTYVRFDARTGGGSIEIVANPLDLEPDRRTAAYRRLKSAQKRFIERLREDRRGARGEQLELIPL